MIHNIESRTDIRLLSKGRRLELDRLSISSEQKVNFGPNPKTKTVAWLQGMFKVAGRATKPVSMARRFLTQNAALLGVPTDMKNIGENQMEKIGDDVRVYFRQAVGGVPVFGAGVVVDITSKRLIRGVGVRLVRISKVPARGKVSQDEAIKRSLEACGIKNSLPLKGELVIADLNELTTNPRRMTLAWSFVLETKTGAQQVLIDTRDGNILLNARLPSRANGWVVTALNPLPRYHLHTGTDTPTFISFAPTGLVLPKITSSDPEQIARDFFSTYPKWFGTGDPERQLRVIKKQIHFSKTGMAHITFQQVFGGVPVFGAYLKVHLKESLEITSISGTYVRWPAVVPVPAVDKEKALEEAAINLTAFRLDGGAALSFDRDLENVRKDASNPSTDSDIARLLRETQAEVSQSDLVILPSTLSGRQASENHLAWRVRFPEADLFVSARSGKLLFALSNRHFVERRIHDNLGVQDLVPGPLVLNDGQEVPPGRDPGTEAKRADDDLKTTIDWYRGLGLNSFDDQGTDVVLMVNCNNPFSPDSSYWDNQRLSIWMGTGFALNDVLAHEFTHGVTGNSADLIYLDEPGALSEHYSDVMGNLCFPDATSGQWQVGELAIGGPYRDMADPAIKFKVNGGESGGQPVYYADFCQRGAGCTGILDPLKDKCDYGNVHKNSGIGNRAAVLLCDGSWTPPSSPTTTTPPTTPGHTGIGRDNLARLFLYTLTTRMHPWSTYMDELLNTWQTALDLFDSTIAQEVLWAFSQVGIDPRFVSGVYEPDFSGNGQFTEDLGPLPANMRVSRVILHVTAYNPFGNPIWSDSVMATDANPQPTITFPGGIFGLTIVNSGIHTPNKTVTINWFAPVLAPCFGFWVTFDYETVTGASRPALPEWTSSHFINHNPDWGGNNDGHEVVNEGDSLVGTNCQITEIRLDLLDMDSNGRYTLIASQHLGEPGVEKPRNHPWEPTYGAYLEEDGVGTTDMKVKVRWWLEPPCTCRFRVFYEFTGQGCHPLQ